MHERPAEPWSIAQLASEAAMSRLSFSERLSRAVGVTPMAWRMTVAKKLLRQRERSIAERVGYSSASIFGVAFTRHVGMPLGRYSRGEINKLRDSQVPA